MIKVIVPSGEGKFTEFPHENADLFSVDDDGRLWLYRRNQKKIVYNAGCWLKAEMP